ncbi:MAG TPA: MBL fold metallo-hydrolase [Stackebrandtia sp.]|uniref:MBL fold metallo-hydrolase n=1 Tax=Stackebrandtia sp. TaxID=2023065 RepID=UPI002D3C5625|nr:MBL fold metallo-hydrolase [Stackebrandtia sp.]HZE40887.1 MBL fold metallo-hydrolase [Stackebrandtia sp.]
MSDGTDRTPNLRRRTLMKLTGASALAAAAPLALPADADASGGSVKVRWLGTNAWEFTTAKATVLIDPWVSRFPTGAYQGGADPDTKIEVRPDAIDEHVTAADCVLVTHGHYDHIADVPYIAKRTGATVIGTETHLNLLRAMDAPEEQLGQVVGGEYYQFDGFTVEVFPSSHSTTGEHKQILFGGTRPGVVPKRPTRIKHLVEGGSLTYLLDFGDVSFFNAGSANFDEPAIDGIRPTVLFVQPGGDHTPDYVERLLEATGYPPYVIPSHWDDFDQPLTKPAAVGIDWRPVRDRVAKASPDSTFILIDHLESHDF